MTFGDKFSASEVDNAFGEFLIEDGMIDAVHLKGKTMFSFNSIHHPQVTFFCIPRDAEVFSETVKYNRHPITSVVVSQLLYYKYIASCSSSAVALL